MATARYDAVADFYETGWTDTYADSVSTALFELLGPVTGLHLLDAACGHGRISREPARRGATVEGLDLSEALIEKALAAEREQQLGIRYQHADIATAPLGNARFDAVVCSFGLSDIDNLDPALEAVSQALRPDSRLVFSILHPCFPGGFSVSGSWPTTSSYYDERWWTADGTASSLRRQVGANHRMLSTYINTLRRHNLWLDAMIEPDPPSEWSTNRRDAALHPVFLVARCIKR
jgi:2-polyprenyl-3-methyl-5-hydroxy-6-metoxy-1,4-benzoquinol methylase